MLTRFVLVLSISGMLAGCEGLLPWVGKDDGWYEGIPNTAPKLPQAPYGNDQPQATIPESRQVVGLGNPPLCERSLYPQFTKGKWKCVRHTRSSFFFWWSR